MKIESYNILIKGFDKKLIKDDNIYVVALSGGSDSMCLISHMLDMKKEKDIILKAIHINHGIRGAEAKRDEDFVRRYCKDNDIDLYVSNVDCIKYAKDNHKTLEEAARILRYKEFDKYIKDISDKEKKKVYLLVAHHKKDKVETIIHNLVRGTGIRGLVGIEKENGYILRPMLNVSKDDIDKYIKDNDIPYVEDSTNDDEDYTRNYIRKTVISDLEKVNDKAIDHICDMASDIKEVDEYFESLSQYIYDNIFISYDKSKHVLTIDNETFKKERHISKIYIIRHILDTLCIPKKDIARVHMDDIIDMSMKEKGGHLDMPYNLTIDKKKKKLYFTVNDKNISMSKRNKI